MELNFNKKSYFCTSPCSKTQSAHAVLQISDPLKNKIAAMGRINPVSILYPRTEPSPPSPTQKSNGFSLFHWYFLLAYYVLYVPFKPVKHQSGKVSLKISKVQKALCFMVVWPLIIIYFAYLLMERFTSFLVSEEYHANQYFKLVYSTMHCINVSMYLWIITKKMGDIEILFGMISKCSLLAVKWKTSQKIAMIYMIFMHIAMITVGILMFLFYGTSVGGPTIFPSEQLNVAIKLGRMRFHVENATTIDHTYLNLSLGIFELMLQLARLWNDCFMGMFFCGALPFTFWSAATGFETMLESYIIISEKNPTQGEILQPKIVAKFEELAELTKHINSTYSTLTILWILKTTLHMVVRLNESVKSKGLLLGYIGSTSLFLATALILMAEGCRVLGRFKEWLSMREAREQIFVNRNELELLERRLDIGEIGIGAAGFFQVNYRLVSELVVFTVTIFLITFDDRTANLIGNSCPCSVKPTL